MEELITPQIDDIDGMLEVELELMALSVMIFWVI